MKIQPSKRLKKKHGLADWEVYDNKNKLVGTFSTRDKTRDRYENLVAQATIRDLNNDLDALKIKIKELTANKEWQIKDRATQAASHVVDAQIELALITAYLKDKEPKR